MFISRFQSRNYKSFREPRALEFAPGFNIISGQNNAGKTALLEALGLSFTGKPHRSGQTIPARDSIPDQVSLADVSFTLPPKELKEFMLASSLGQFEIAQPEQDSEFARSIGYTGDPQKLLAAIFSQDQLTFKLRFLAPSGQPPTVATSVPSLTLYPPYRVPPMGNRSPGYNYVFFRLPDTNGIVMSYGNGFMPDGADIGIHLTSIFQRHIYRFSAERLNLSRCAHGESPILQQNASNLAEVLNRLQSNPSRFRDLNCELSTILPQVKWVSVLPMPKNQMEIRVWPHDPSTRRDDLAIPLSESGTGIGQVLAILYVVMTSDRPQVIIIDEPQSFLHPGAARKLIDFLSVNAHHQFIMATHSPTIIAAAAPKTVTLVRYEDAESTLEQVDVEQEKGIQDALADLGVRLSDSFGADSILWVEGQTEEKCFRLIVEKLLRRRLRGTEILGVRQTGDFEGRDARRVLDVYRRLSSGASMLPPALGFIFDRECKSERTRDDLSRMGVKFLPRRMYENYLLDPEAIALVTNSIDGFSSRPLAAGDVSALIQEKLIDPGYYCTREHASSPNRTQLVDGARVLAETFRELSETRVEYEKVRHGVTLTEWLIKNRPSEFDDLKNLLSQVLSAGA